MPGVMNIAYVGKHLRCAKSRWPVRSTAVRASSAAPNLPDASSVSDQAGAKKNASIGSTCFISGFSPFACRRDLDLALGGRSVKKVDPYLDAMHFPTGMYAISVENKHEAAELRQKFSNLADSNNPKFKIHHPQFHPPKAWVPSSELNVTSKTIRCHTMDSRVGADEIMFFFDDFDLRYDSIRKFNHDRNDRRAHYLVDFRCPEEAERAVAENNHNLLFGKIVHLLWFQA